MRQVLKSALVLVAAAGLTGCASIMKGTRQEVTFRSNPEGATVYVGGKVIGTTPVTIALKRKSSQELRFEKEGYKPLSMKLETTINNWLWGNIVIGGVVGSITDGISGAAIQYSPSQYLVSLEPGSASSLESDTSKNTRQKTKDFIVISYQEIRNDLQKGEGPFLSSLFELLSVPPEDQPSAQKTIHDLSAEHSDIVDFADSVINTYLPEG